MVIAKGKEVLGSALFMVEFDEFFGSPVLGFEEWQDILESHFCLVAVVLTVVFPCL